jgi:hypothetical protein
MKESILPERIDCTLALEKRPVTGLMLLAEFTTVRKNSYGIVFGPSDQEGQASLTYEELKRRADSQLELGLMDFDPIDKAFSGEISVKVMNYDDIQKAIIAYDLFESVGCFPANYRENLERSLQILQQIDATAVKIEIVFTPGPNRPGVA